MPVGAALLLVGVDADADVVDDEETADAELQLISNVPKNSHQV